MVMNKTLTSLIQLQELMCRYENAGHPASLRRQADRLRTKLPETILRQFDRLAEHGRLPVAHVSASGACGSCHLQLTASDVLRLRHALESNEENFSLCPFCGGFLYSPVALSGVAQTSKSAVSQVSQPASRARDRRSADLGIGDTAGLETRATKSSVVANGKATTTISS